MNEKIIPLFIDVITVPPFVERPSNRVRDELLRNAIRDAGRIEQPLIVVPEGDRYWLAKGLRRLERARELDMRHVPVILRPAPRGVPVELHIRRLRFITTHHRQDLVASQKCAFVKELRSRYNLRNNREIGRYVGVAPDTVSNWLAVQHYLPEIVAAMDADILTMNAARTFDGMSEEGQRTLWKRHRRQFLEEEGGKLHKELRAKYPPENYPHYYKNAELIAKRLAAPSGKRQAKTRGGMSPVEKKRLQGSLDLRETELAETARKQKLYDEQIEAAIAPISAILRTPDLRKAVPAEMLEDFIRFAEVYAPE